MIDLSALGASSSGVWTRPEALALLTSGQIAALVRDNVWQVVFRGVYADGGYELTAEQWAAAALLATGGAGQPLPFGEPRADGSQPVRLVAAACVRTAARVWGLPLIDDDDPATGGTDRFVHDVHAWRALPPPDDALAGQRAPRP